jgi:biotin carboxyl carrier protein
MNFEIELQEDSRSSEHSLSIERPSNGKDGATGLRFSLDGKPIEADWAEIRPGRYSILIGGQSYEARVTPAPDNLPGQPDRWIVAIAEYDFHIHIRDPRTRRFAGQTATHEGPLDVLAPMPGKIVSVLVEPGQDVAENQGLVVIEAMKMQNELRAPRAGNVTQVHVKEGIGIEAGARLLRLE